MARRARQSEPSFGSDSFLDVTANLVGALIVLIVLVGLRAGSAPPHTRVVDGESDHRLQAMKSEISTLNVARLELGRDLDNAQQGLAAKQATLAGLLARDSDATPALRSLSDELRGEADLLHLQDLELAEARDRLVSLAGELERLKEASTLGRVLTHRSPLSRRVDTEEIFLELKAGRVTFIDLRTLSDMAKKKAQVELATRNRTSGQVGPIGGFQLRYVAFRVRDDKSFTEAALSNSFKFFTQWEELKPTEELRGEPAVAALKSGSQLKTVLARHSPNKYAVTIWTYPDSFAAFRLLRDDLAEYGYIVAARPMPDGVHIGAAPNGSRSFAQ